MLKSWPVDSTRPYHFILIPDKNVCNREKPCAQVANTHCVVDPTDQNKYTCECRENFVRQVADMGDSTAPCFGKLLVKVCESRVLHVQVERVNQTQISKLA